MGIQVNFSGLHTSSWGQYSGAFQGSGAMPASSMASVPETGSVSNGSIGSIPSVSHASETSGAHPGESGEIQGRTSGLPPEEQGKIANTEGESKGSENTESRQKESASGTRDFSELSQAEKQLVTELQQTDTRVHNHEMSHLAAAGSLATSGATYEYKKGPDGNKYAVAGEVHIDVAPVPGDPEATLRKMQQVKRAALAPADPSSQDRRVAAKATATAAKARAEIMQQQAVNGQTSQAPESPFAKHSYGMDVYMKGAGIPQENASSFALAV